MQLNMTSTHYTHSISVNARTSILQQVDVYRVTEKEQADTNNEIM